MCHYNYRGYDICSHEHQSAENAWVICALRGNLAPRHCPFVTFTRHKTGTPWCESCLDETPPNHLPVTRIIVNFENLRTSMAGAGVGQAVYYRFAREYKAALRGISDAAATAGPNNNYYNDVAALYDAYYRRAMREVDRLNTW